MEPSKYLSNRAQHTLKQYDLLISSMYECENNQYHAQTNPKGIANIGSAVDTLMASEIEDRLNREDAFKFIPSEHQHYFKLYGRRSLQNAAANFINKYFGVHSPISPENIIIMCGSSSCYDSLSFTLFDPGDVYIMCAPGYGRFYTDFNDRSLAQPCFLHLPEEPDENGIRFNLTPQLLEDRILELKSEGKSVKGFILSTPNNPLGCIYSPSLILQLLEVCAKYKLHVIVSQLYALTLLDTEAEVTTALSLPNIPDPERTHFVWGLSKDFGLAGLRIGVIHTVNKDILKVLKDVAFYCCCPSIVQDTVATILEDTNWLEEYIPLRRKRLQERYILVKEKLEDMGIDVLDCEGGLFLWFNLKKFMKSQTTEAEMELHEELLDAGVFIVPGGSMFCQSPGWFRIVFTAELHHLQRGLDLLERSLKMRAAKLGVKLGSIANGAVNGLKNGSCDRSIMVNGSINGTMDRATLVNGSRSAF